MNLKKKKELVDNFLKLNDIVSLNRSLSLITIQQLIKKIKKQENTLIAYMSFLDQLQKNESEQINEQKTLYIYYAANEKFTSNFYNAIEDHLLNHFLKDKDLLISLGKRAFDFSQESLLTTPVHHYDDPLDFKKIPLESALLIARYLKEKRVNRVVFLIRSNKTNNINTVLYPLNEFDFQLSLEENDKMLYQELNNQNFRFYETASDFNENALIGFLSSALYTLLLESSFIVYKNKLIHENKILKDLEVRIKRAKMSLNRSVREQEIQELNLIHDHKKQGLKKYGKTIQKNHH
ncbi:MSC_0622 family F1-like ATPase gamma subunit [Ureaplasma zalophigenitalium]|uniref:ATP synthase gamma chain n=1 Tax=Ureaplasma zalophigenitalium TaxID=907723 RepID=A0ABT3BPF2_9BACT|nr:hypothetical protein [Ureaplasma zalophigenitalium]MCV3754102.1 hypothetical protein [Ureaplasma zalophigenitalium]